MLEARESPIVTLTCYCDDCQAAGRQFESTAPGRAVLTEDGGTPYVVYRKDRVKCVRGAESLVPHKLRPHSATSRFVATCCCSPMYLAFDDRKHWVDVYQDRVRETAPALEMSVCTRFRSSPEPLKGTLPNYPGYPFKFVAKLLLARVAMRFPDR